MILQLLDHMSRWLYDDNDPWKLLSWIYLILKENLNLQVVHTVHTSINQTINEHIKNTNFS